MIIIPDARLPDFLNFNIRSTLLLCTYHLYQNNYTPDGTSDITDFDECDFTGYAALPSDDWGLPFLNADLYGEVKHPILVYTCTAGSQDVYGYFVTDDDDNYLFAERNPAGLVVVSVGLSYFVLPRFESRNFT